MKALSQKLFLFLCILSLLVLAACSSSAEPSASRKPSDSPQPSTGGKTIYVGITNTPATLNPINGNELASQRISAILFESLFELTESMEFLPKLADSMETNDNRSFTIKLNPKVKWTDGQPFTGEDIAFTLQLMANPKVISTGIQPLSAIEGLDDEGRLPEGQMEIKGITVVDPHTVTIRTKAPVDINYLKEKLGVDVQFLPKHVLKDAAPEQLHQHPFMQNPNVTNGAFTFVKFTKDQYVEFVANKDYYRGAPKIDKLFFKVMPSANIVAQLQTGEIHINEPEISYIGIEDYEKVKNMSNVRTVSGKPLQQQMMFFNMKTIPDAKARQAIVHAINRQLLVDKLMQGAAEVFEGPYTPVHPYYNPDVKKYSYDPEKAKQLLQEAGWDFNKTIDLAVPSGFKTREQAAVIIAENLRAVGLKVQINKYDLPTIIQRGQKHQFDLFMLGLPFTLDPDRTTFYQTGAAYNFPDYSNARVDELIDKGKKEADPEKRRAIYNEFVDMIQQDLPTIALYGEKPLKAISKKVIAAEPTDRGMYYNVHEWDIE